MLKLNLSLVLTAALIAGNAQAANLALSGTVDPVNTITINASGSYNALDIVGGVTNATIASVDETSNNLLGYKIMMSSTNAGQLKNASDANKKTAYTISYNGASAVTPGSGPAQVKSVPSLSGLTTATSAVKINVTPYATAPAGVYSDTLILAIVAN